MALLARVDERTWSESCEPRALDMHPHAAFSRWPFEGCATAKRDRHPCKLLARALCGANVANVATPPYTSRDGQASTSAVTVGCLCGATR
mmetsp:Transcript_33180/g.87189  ORF Transcript_33180/g.87189 Transcript_33180/m.87189 type:complete len:90 (+) Transcript_33180:376-645(+)